jgi:SEP domain
MVLGGERFESLPCPIIFILWVAAVLLEEIMMEIQNHYLRLGIAEGLKIKSAIFLEGLQSEYFWCPTQPGSANKETSLFCRGNTTGSDEAESQVIPGSNVKEVEFDTAIRSITFWKSGFTLGDGPLLLYTDPDSAKLLESIQQGHVFLAAVSVDSLTAAVDSHHRKLST